jgi:hypothetical protein
MPQNNKIKIRRGLVAALPGGGSEVGELRYASDSKELYVDDGTNNIKVGSEAATSGITTALQTALNAKAPLSHTHAVTDLPDFGENGSFVKDDFAVGLLASPGELSWSVSGGTNNNPYAIITPPAGRPGILRRSTSASAGTYAYTRLVNSAAGMFFPAAMFDMLWIFALAQTDTDTGVRIGMGSDPTANPPANGIYLEKLYADTQWFAVTRASAAQTRSAAVATCDTNYHKVRIRRIDASTIGFTFDGGAEITQTLTIPTAALVPVAAIVNQSAVDKSLDIDFFSLRITGLNR